MSWVNSAIKGVSKALTSSGVGTALNSIVDLGVNALANSPNPIVSGVTSVVLGVTDSLGSSATEVKKSTKNYLSTYRKITSALKSTIRG